MRDVPTNLEQIWRSGQYTGDQKPMARITVQHPQMALHTYSLTTAYQGYTPSETGIADVSTEAPRTYMPKGKQVTDIYADFLMENENTPKELRNLRSVSWSRDIDSDVAECTIELYNSAFSTSTNSRVIDIDAPGSYTYNRGSAYFASRWADHSTNEWANLIMPDNIIRTYEGYGVDYDVPPERDPNLMLTGTWIIDSVTATADGLLSVTCRDVGRILMDQYVFPPVVPSDFYPPSFEAWPSDPVQVGEDVSTDDGATDRIPLTPVRSSNVFWNPPGTNPNAPLAGHYLANAFDDDPSTFWLSIGNSLPSRPFAYEWIEATAPNATITEFRFATYKTGYTAYANVMVDGVWQGNNVIPYSRAGIGRNDANIRYVASCPVTTEGEVVLNIGRWNNVQKVRLTLGSLQNIRSSASPYNYRAAIRSFACYNSTAPQTVRTPIMALLTGPEGANPGYYRNYTNIVKLLLAWGGWFWPENGYFQQSDGKRVSPFFIAPDEVEDALGVKDGRVWGDFQQTAAAGPSPIKEDNWDKKTLMDGIAYCSEVTGAIFYIDESGAANFRLPNLYEPGNYRNGLSSRPGRTTDHWIIDERQTLISLSSTISSANVREGVYVSNNTGEVAAIVGGFNPNPTGIRRYGGWTDENFETQAEAERMADMIVIRQLMTYRQDTLTIPGNPGIQIDDQIRVNERVTSEGYLHYVKSIRSSNNLEEGTWTYDMTTHWLGDTAGSDLVNPNTETVVVSRATRTPSGHVATGTSSAGALGSAGLSEDTWLFRLDDLGENTAKSIRQQLRRTNYELVDRRNDTITGNENTDQTSQEDE